MLCPSLWAFPLSSCTRGGSGWMAGPLGAPAPLLLQLICWASFFLGGASSPFLFRLPRAPILRQAAYVWVPWASWWWPPQHQPEPSPGPGTGDEQLFEKNPLAEKPGSSPSPASAGLVSLSGPLNTCPALLGNLVLRAPCVQRGPGWEGQGVPLVILRALALPAPTAP